MRTLDPIEHVRSHREMYLPGGRVDGAQLAARLAGDALLLGASRVEVAHEGEWWSVTADEDWLARGTPGFPEIFARIVPFPEAGVNSMRSEVLLSAFADQVVTIAGGHREVVKGDVTASNAIWRARSAPTTLRGRSVAFRLCCSVAA